MTAPADVEENMGPLRHPCDLDILLFFHRFPRVLLTSEKIAQYVGYDMKQVGNSLETLIAAKLISRSPNPAHDARFYVFTADLSVEWLRAVLSAVGAPNGRTRLIRILKQRGLRQKPSSAGKHGGSSGSSYGAKDSQEAIYG